MIARTVRAVVLKGRGEALTAPPDAGGVNEDKVVAVIGGALDLKGGEGKGERGPLGKNRIVILTSRGAEDGAKEGRGGELEGREEKISNFEVRNMGGEPIEPDSSGRTVERGVEGDEGGIGALCNEGKGISEGREEERFWVG